MRSTFFQGHRSIATQLKAYDGKVWRGRIIDGHTNVIADRVMPVGIDNSGESLTMPRRTWSNLPLANLPTK